MSKLAMALLAVGVILAAGLAYGGYRMYDYVENDPMFCSSCHLMGKAWQTWKAGLHKDLNCHMCHQQNVVDRARIVWHWATRQYDSVPSHTRLDRTVCETCHLSQNTRWAQIGETVGHKIHVQRANLQCLACHLPSLHAVQPQVEACQRCHTSSLTNAGGMVAFHCTTCHDFLGKTTTAEKMVPLRDLCLTCHATMQVKGETFPEGAPMAFSCADCHKPHTQPVLQFADCLRCHSSVLEDQAHFEHRALTDCVQCHRPHSWKATGWR